MQNFYIWKVLSILKWLLLAAKPQFVNCSKEVYAPVGAQNYVISCMIRAKPALTSDVTWSVQPKDSAEFQIQNNNYGYRTDIVGEVSNMIVWFKSFELSGDSPSRARLNCNLFIHLFDIYCPELANFGTEDS